MVIRDHLNLTGRTPLLGPNADELGPRFPDLTDAWSPRLRDGLHAAGEAEGVDLVEGVYAGLLGPQYETPAEVRMLRTLGADAVGMSTVLECIAARWAGLEVCGVSLVTNAGAGYSGQPLTHEEVLAAGRRGRAAARARDPPVRRSAPGGLVAGLGQGRSHSVRKGAGQRPFMASVAARSRQRARDDDRHEAEQERERQRRTRPSR